MRTDQKLESLLEKAANGSLTSSEEKLLRQLQDGSAEIGAAATGDNPLGAEDLNQIAQANAAASTASMTGSATATTTGLSSIGSKLTGLVGPAAAGVGLAAVAGGAVVVWGFPGPRPADERAQHCAPALAPLSG